MTIEIETRGVKTEHGWRDVDGFVGPFNPDSDLEQTLEGHSRQGQR